MPPRVKPPRPAFFQPRIQPFVILIRGGVMPRTSLAPEITCRGRFPERSENTLPATAFRRLHPRLSLIHCNRRAAAGPAALKVIGKRILPRLQVVHPQALESGVLKD